MATIVGTGGAGGTKRDTPHHAWHNLMRTAFVDAPLELKRSYEARLSIQRLRHRRHLQ